MARRGQRDGEEVLNNIEPRQAVFHALTTGTSALLLWAVLGGKAMSPDRSQHIFTGILEEADPISAKGKVRTSWGRPVIIEMEQPELLREVGPGTPVTVQLDGEGRAGRLIKVGSRERRSAESKPPPFVRRE